MKGTHMNKVVKWFGIILLLIFTSACIRLDQKAHNVTLELQSSTVLETISIDNAGNVGDLASNQNDVSGDGRYVVFASRSRTFDKTDMNVKFDIYLKDRQTNTLTRISLANDGTEGNGDSTMPAISNNGQIVVYQSTTSTFDSHDHNGLNDIYLYEVASKTTKRISTGLNSDSNGASLNPRVSANGRYIVFESSATNLINSDTNNVSDIFLYDRITDQVKRVSVSNNQIEANGSSSQPDISADGAVIAFQSTASNLVPSDRNNRSDIFVYERNTQQTKRVSIHSNGTEGSSHSFAPSLSTDGHLIAFESFAPNIVTGDRNGLDIYVHDQRTGLTERINLNNAGQQGNGAAKGAAISGDGRYVAYQSTGTNLVPGSNSFFNVYLYDRQQQDVQRLSEVSLGILGNKNSSRPRISANGQNIVFYSEASNFASNDNNNTHDVFLHGNPYQPPSSPPSVNSCPLEDPSLEALVRLVIKKPYGTLNQTDLLSINTLNAYGQGIRSLKGLDCARNLTNLNLGNNHIKDIEPLRHLTRLETLNILENQITSIEPLKNLSNLRVLHANNNQIQSITALRNLRALEQLRLYNNQITDASVISNLNNLKDLRINRNQLTDASFIRFLPLLQELYIGSNQLTVMTPFLENPGLGAGDVLVIQKNCFDYNAYDDRNALEALRRKGFREFHYVFQKNPCTSEHMPPE